MTQVAKPSRSCALNRIDPVGEFHALIRDRNFPETYSITVYLKDAVDSHVLQQAVNDLAKRVPSINYAHRRTFFNVYHVSMPAPPQVMPVNKLPNTCSYYSADGTHLFRVLYSENSFTAEIMHSTCDGRALTEIVKALTVRYFELLPAGGDDGSSVSRIDKSQVLDCDMPADPEESEDAWNRWFGKGAIGGGTVGDERASTESKGGGVSVKRAHLFECAELGDNVVSSLSFNLGELKSAAKERGASINEYLLTHIFMALSEQRAEESAADADNLLPLTCSIPIDCRSFFPSKTLQNFCITETIAMPLQTISKKSWNQLAGSQKLSMQGLSTKKLAGRMKAWPSFAFSHLPYRQPLFAS